tara:strand:- start:141 stop:458 length:318 start_codon:yes stop_codon:yes gene_type:complete
MKYNTILSVPKDKEARLDSTKILDFIKGLGYRLQPVRGSYNKYWFTGKVEDGEFLDFIDGAKYYKLIINSRDFGIQAIGDYNAWSFASDIRTAIRAQRDSNKGEK